MKMFLAALVILGPAIALARGCQGEMCGEELKAKGWQEIARCEGHSWSYLLTKDGKAVRCQGINALAGPEEDPCAPVQMSAKEFKQVDTQETACGRIEKGKTQ